MTEKIHTVQKVFAEKLLTIKAALEEKSKTVRGLTLMEDLQLQEINFLIASGFTRMDINIFEAGGMSNNANQINKKKSNFIKLTKLELIEKLTEAELTIQDLNFHLERESLRFKFLFDLYETNRKKRVSNTKNRKDERKNGKAKVNDEKFELARLVFNEMSDEYQTLNSSHAREFYRRLKDRCDKNNLEHPSATSLSNYFKKITGINSTK